MINNIIASLLDKLAYTKTIKLPENDRFPGRNFNVPDEWNPKNKPGYVENSNSIFVDDITDIDNNRPGWCNGNTPLYIRWNKNNDKYEVSKESL